MARKYHRTYTPLTPDPNGLCEDQTTVGAGNLTLDGALVTNGVYDTTDGLAHQISIESAGNLSGVDFTITGTDISGAALTETVTGPNATTVESSEYFKTITQVAVDGAVGTNVELGPVDEAHGPLIVLDPVGTTSVSVGCEVTGTINYDIDDTYDNVQDNALSTVSFTDTSINGETAAAADDFTTKVTALRLVINSYTAGATIDVNVIPDTKLK